MQRQWGSCSTSQSLTLNPHLIKTPRDCIDYVLVHELVHMVHHHHGPEFFRLLDQSIPDWQKTKSKLDKLVEVVMNE